MSAPKIANPFTDTGMFLRQAGSIALTTSGVGLIAGGIDALNGNKGGINENLLSMGLNGGRTANQTRAEASNAANAEEAQARSDVFNASLQDNDIDSKTRQELAELYDGGASSVDIANKLNAARSGKGIYAVRKINQNEKSIYAQQPGRKQLLTLGKDTVLGG